MMKAEINYTEELFEPASKRQRHRKIIVLVLNIGLMFGDDLG